MQYVIKILTTIIPYLLRFIDKHSDEYLELLNKRISKFIGADEVATVRFYVIDEQGNSINNYIVSFNADKYGEVFKKSVNGNLSITGFKEGKYMINISADGYERTWAEVEFEDTNYILEKAVVLKHGTD